VGCGGVCVWGVGWQYPCANLPTLAILGAQSMGRERGGGGGASVCMCVCVCVCWCVCVCVCAEGRGSLV
jgi:hypothetical protein